MDFFWAVDLSISRRIRVTDRVGELEEWESDDVESIREKRR